MQPGDSVYGVPEATWGPQAERKNTSRENADKKGNVFYNVTVVRRYQSAPDEWSNSNSYTGLGDLALLREAVDLAAAVLREKAVKGEVKLDEVA